MHIRRIKVSSGIATHLDAKCFYKRLNGVLEHLRVALALAHNLSVSQNKLFGRGFESLQVHKRRFNIKNMEQEKIENIVRNYIKEHLKVEVTVTLATVVRVKLFLDKEQICEDVDYS